MHLHAESLAHLLQAGPRGTQRDPNSLHFGGKRVLSLLAVQLFSRKTLLPGMKRAIQRFTLLSRFVGVTQTTHNCNTLRANLERERGEATSTPGGIKGLTGLFKTRPTFCKERFG